MAEAITVPRSGWSMEEGTFAGWLKRDGDRVERGDTLYVLESDKAAEEIEAVDAGILRIPADAPKSGDLVKVGQVLAFLAAEGETVPTTVGGQKSEIREQQSASGSQRPGDRGESNLPASAVPLPRTDFANPASSPRARRVAAELGIDWRGLTGSGRDGRVRERDVRAAAGAGGRLIQHTGVRRAIAARMVAGVTQAAPVTLTTKVNATNLVALRNRLKAAVPPPGEAVPGYTDLILKLASQALARHPLLQAQWRDDGLFVPGRIDIALSVAADAGLFAPVVRGVDRLTIFQIATRTLELISLARAGKLTADQMRDATFTVTNLGNYGIDAFTPILTLPQCAVLGVGRILREPTVVGDQIAPQDLMTLSLTFDHRVVDGAPAAEFLRALCACIQNPQW